MPTKAQLDKERIAGFTTMLAETFRQKVSPALLEAYRIGLDGIPVEKIGAGVATALRTCKFMPAPSELRELCGEMKLPDRAVRAFMALENAIVSIGGYKTVDFDDGFINATVRALGGWVSVCETPADEFDKFFKQKFEKTYSSLVSAGIGSEQAEPLQGRHDRSNSIGGYGRQEIQRIATGLPRLANEPARVALPAPKPQVEPKRIPRLPAPDSPKPVVQDDGEISVFKQQIAKRLAEMAGE